MSNQNKDLIDKALLTIKLAGLKAEVKKTEYTDKKGKIQAAFSINIKGGTRPVSVWPIQGTVFASPKKRKKVDGGGWQFKKPVSVKKLSFDAAIYTAVQTALMT